MRYTGAALSGILYPSGPESEGGKTRYVNRMNKRETGPAYESAAARFLETKGYRILERNYRCRFGEVDLIAQEGNTIVFCEVKFRRDLRVGHPLEAVDLRKQHRISKCALCYLTENRLSGQECRFDVVGICGEEITLIRNAFEYVE